MARVDYYVWPRWDLITGYKWTLSGSGTAEYYLTTIGDTAVPNLTDPPMVEGNAIDFTQGTLGSLTASQFDWGDNDALGFSTLYVRLADDTDPDSKAAGFVKAGGDDAAAGTSEAVAFETFQGALNGAPRDATDGDVMNFKAGAADVLTATPNTAIYGASTQTAPLMIRGYAATIADGGQGEISCGGGNRQLISANRTFTHWQDMKLGNSITSSLITIGSKCFFEDVEFHTCTASIMVDANGLGTQFLNCYFHSHTGIAAMLRINAGGVMVYGCFFKGGTTSKSANEGLISTTSSSTYGAISNNVFHCNHTTQLGIASVNSSILVSNNSIYNEAGGTEAGILNTGSSNAMMIVNNIIEGWAGVGGAGIENIAAIPMSYIAGNVFFNNTANLELSDETVIEFSNSTAFASLFTDPANEDFRVTTEAQGIGIPSVFKGAPLTTNYLDAGASQRIEAAASGTVAYASA